jgi:beta-lactamase class A
MLRLLLMLAAAVSGHNGPTAPVHVTLPRPYEVWDGRVQGRTSPGAYITVRAGTKTWTVQTGKHGRFDEMLRRIPRGDTEVTIAKTLITPVYGLPPGSIQPMAAPSNDPKLGGRLATLADRVTPHVGIYSHAWNGSAAAYNAGAEFEAASTLKLPIMLVALSQNDDELPSSEYWELMSLVARYSDNAAANRLLVLTGGTKTGGAAAMVELMRNIGLRHTFMVGGYLTGGGGPPLLTIVDQPPSAYKYTTAGDMARLAALLTTAAAGRGPLLRHGIDQHEARQLLYLMAHAEDEGLVRAGAGNLPVAHKIGWLEETNNDVGIIFTYGGPVVVAIYTFGPQDGTAQAFGTAATGAVLTSLKDGA